MDYSLAAGSLESAGDLHPEFKHLLDRQRLSIHVLLERLTFEQLHDEELLPLVFSHVVNGADVRIVQRGCRVCFALEALLRTGFSRETRRQNLDSDVSFETLRRRAALSRISAHSFRNLARREKSGLCHRTGSGAIWHLGRLA
jgi:hypothetical protein